MVGFTNDDAPTLVFPGAFDPFHVANSAAARQRRGGQAQRKKASTRSSPWATSARPAGTLTDPTGPLIDLADSVTDVDVVIGDHTDFQVLTTRPNGVLVVENRSKGIRFTRVRLVVDAGTKAVVYKTADFHKPWNIGVTPDPAIQAEIDELNAQLAPILGTVIGESTVADPARGRVRTRRWPAVRVAGRQRRHRRDARPTYARRRRVRDHELRRPARRADLPAGGRRSGFCPAYTPPPFPITRGQVLGGAAVRQRRRHADDQRRRAEGDAGERRLAMPARGRPVPAGLRALLHLRHRGAGRQPGDRRGAPGRRRHLHRRRRST